MCPRRLRDADVPREGIWTHPSGVKGFPPERPGISDAVCAAVARYMATWAWIESAIDRMSVALVRRDHQIVSAMMAVLRKSKADVLHAAAKDLLSKDDLELFDWVLARMEPFEEQRNKFAHHLWLSLDSNRDALLLLPPKFMTERAVARRDIELILSPDNQVTGWRAEEAVSSRVRFWQHAWLYKLEELESMHEPILEAYNWASNLELMLSDRPWGVEILGPKRAIYWGGEDGGATPQGARARLTKARADWSAVHLVHATLPLPQGWHL